MSVYVIEDTPETPIPRPVGKVKTTYSIVSLPGKHLVTRGVAGKSIAVDLDPGKYTIAVAQFRITGEGTAERTKWTKTFYHQITPDQHSALAMTPLRFSRGLLTTEGLRYTCKLPGCDEESTSKIAALVHEASHSGVDLLAKSETHPSEIPPPQVGAQVIEATVAAERHDRIQRLREAALRK